MITKYTGGVSFNKSLTKEFFKDRSISEEVLYDAFKESIAEVFSLESGLSIEVDLDGEDNLTIYTNRRISDDPIGFGEVSSQFVQENQDLYEVKDGIAKELIKRTSISSLNRNMISKMQKALQTKLVKIDKAKEFDTFKDKVGELLSGSIARIEHGNIIVNLGLGEGFLGRNETIPGEFFNINTNIQAYMFDIQENHTGYQIMLTRNRPEFIEKIISSMIPEVKNGMIEVVSVARDPGIRCKIAVWSEYPNIDPVGSCIGKHGIRIKSIRSLIGNERLDIVKWDEDPAIFIGNALFPIEVSKFIFYSEKEVELVLSEENLAKINAHRRQQIKLTQRLTGFRIRVISEDENSERSQVEDKIASEIFKKLEISDSNIKYLLSKNIKSIYELLTMSDLELKRIISLEEISDEEFASFKKKLNKAYLEELKEEYIKSGVDSDLAEIPHILYASPSIFVENEVFSREALSTFGKDDIISMFIEFLSEDQDERVSQANDILVWSREKKGG